MSTSIIIPSRTANNLIESVRSLGEAGETMKIVVVDDGLGPLPGEISRTIQTVQGVKPFVYARNINIGIRAAGEDDVILLNDDAKLKTPMGFTRMFEEANKYPELGVVSAACNNVGNTNQHPRGIGMRTDDRMVCFVAVLIKRTTINSVGMLDERYVKYGLDDDDYCFRVRGAGLKIGIYDNCFVDHSELVSTYRGGPADAGDFKPNLRLFIEKWGYDNRGLTKEQSPWRGLFA